MSGDADSWDSILNDMARIQSSIDLRNLTEADVNEFVQRHVSDDEVLRIVNELKGSTSDLVEARNFLARALLTLQTFGRFALRIAAIS